MAKEHKQYDNMFMIMCMALFIKGHVFKYVGEIDRHACDSDTRPIK